MFFNAAKIIISMFSIFLSSENLNAVLAPDMQQSSGPSVQVALPMLAPVQASLPTFAQGTAASVGPADGFATRRRGQQARGQEQMFDKGRSTQNPDYTQVPTAQAFEREIARVDNLEARMAAVEAQTSNPNGGIGLATVATPTTKGSIQR